MSSAFPIPNIGWIVPSGKVTWVARLRNEQKLDERTIIFWDGCKHSNATMTSNDESFTVSSWTYVQVSLFIFCLQLITKLMLPVFVHCSGHGSFLKPCGQGILGLEECRGISVDPVWMLASMAAAICVYLPICFISGNQRYKMNQNTQVKTKTNIPNWHFQGQHIREASILTKHDSFISDDVS